MPKEHSLTGRALVTGGSSGIGRGFARALAARGLDLVLVGRNQARLDETAAALEAKYQVAVETISADLSTPSGVAAVENRLTSAVAPVNVLVNNAGCGLHLPAATTDSATLCAYEQALDLMVKAPFLLGTVAAAVFAQRGGGLIINVASVNALVPMGAYSAMKAFVKTWSQALALRVSAQQVQVLTFMPGWTHTEHHQRAGISTANIPRWLWLEADAITEQCVAAAEKGKTYFVPAAKFKTLAFLAQHAPAGAIGGVMRKFNRGRQAASAQQQDSSNGEGTQHS